MIDELREILNGFYRERRGLESLNLKSKVGAVEIYVKFKKQIKQWAMGLLGKDKKPEEFGSYTLNKSWAQGYNQALAEIRKKIEESK